MQKGDSTLMVWGDPFLAGGLAAMGIPPILEEKIHNHDSGRTQYCWHMSTRSIDGTIVTASLIDGWKHPEEFNAKHTERHPWSVFMMGLKNARGFKERQSMERPKVILRRGSACAVVDPSARQDVTDHILQRIGF